MKDSLDHLPPAKQAELERIRTILFEEFEQATALATGTRRRKGRVLKIVLFGSHARGDWVKEDKHDGYQSDFDILIVVNNKALLQHECEAWNFAEDRIMHDRRVRTPVTVIVHTLEEMNHRLSQGHYFFTDIRGEGIALYEARGHPFAEQHDLEPGEALDVAREHFEEWFPGADDFLRLSDYAMKEGMAKKAAFLLHQATESLYAAVLLVFTNYTPNTHNIKHLRSLADDVDERLIPVWPRRGRRAKALYSRLKDAYVKARYSRHYRISADDLAWLREKVGTLRDVAGAVCRERLEFLEKRVR